VLLHVSVQEGYHQGTGIKCEIFYKELSTFYYETFYTNTMLWCCAHCWIL